MTMHEFWEALPTWEIIVFSIYLLVLTIYLFAVTIIGVDGNDIPFFLVSRIGYDYLVLPCYLSLIVFEVLMLPAQLLLLCIYGVVQLVWNIKEYPRKERKHKAKKQ
jgi:hypothetical protein